MENTGQADTKKRSIRSFVKRSGRLTTGQQEALEQLWPRYGIEFDATKKLDFVTIFAGLESIKLEIGFGNGDSLVQMAHNDPGSGYLGIEVHEPGVGHCLIKAEQTGVENLRIMSRDALDILEYMIPDATLDAVFLFFPDPWHKKKHHKRRIVNRLFRDEMARVLKPGGVLHMATDWQDYAEHMAENMLADERFTNLGDENGFSPKPDYRPQTKFERRGLKFGHGVWDLMFRLSSSQ